MNVQKLGNAGIKCDNPKCDFVDKETPDEKLAEWLNVPCPKCGENLLTQEDLDSAIAFDAAMSMVNGLSAEQLEAMAKMFGIENTESSDNEVFIVDIHNGIKITTKGDETA